MEAVHRPTYRAWIDDRIVNVRSFLERWKNALFLETDEFCTNLKTFFSEEEYNDLEKECGLDSMRCLHQENVEPAVELVIPDGVNLDTLKFQAEDLAKRTRDQRYSGIHYITMKYRNYPPRKNVSIDLSHFDFVPVDTPEVIMNVQIFRPERRIDSKTCVTPAKMPGFHVDLEFSVLGCQYLTELRDKIECMSDKVIPGEYSDYPSSLPSVTCKDLYKSGFFYINGIFYNDMRDKDCRDYSEPIRNWASKHNRGVGPFKSTLMEKTQFIDLDIQLGYPYVYIHQGDCEHLIVFTDLRMFSKHDVANRNAYPVYVQVKPSKRTFCMVCRVYTCSWVVYDSDRVPENPFFYCKQCFFKFNYDSNNQKIGNFKAYNFPDNTKLA